MSCRPLFVSRVRPTCLVPPTRRRLMAGCGVSFRANAEAFDAGEPSAPASSSVLAGPCGGRAPASARLTGFRVCLVGLSRVPAPRSARPPAMPGIGKAMVGDIRRSMSRLVRQGPRRGPPSFQSCAEPARAATRQGRRVDNKEPFCQKERSVLGCHDTIPPIHWETAMRCVPELTDRQLQILSIFAKDEHTPIFDLEIPDLVTWGLLAEYRGRFQLTELGLETLRAHGGHLDRSADPEGRSQATRERR
jgi:hypothetical protein